MQSPRPRAPVAPNTPQPGIGQASLQLARAVAHGLGRLSARRRLARLFRWVTATLALTLLLSGGMVLWTLLAQPVNLNPARDSSLLIAAADGLPMGRSGPLGMRARRADLPDILVKAVLSIEDRRFFQHWGVDPRGLARAVEANWKAGRFLQGGSTITQQLAKMQFDTPERSLKQKLRELVVALWMERRLGKDEILTRYVNSVYLGSGVYGMAAAARAFFDKPLPELDLAEAALLAGVIQAPAKLDPARNLVAARKRAATVLDAMLTTGAIDAQAAARAKAQPAKLKLSPVTAPARSWFADWLAKSEAPKLPGMTELTSPGGRKTPLTLRIRTTLESELQTLAEQIVGRALADKPQTGALVAMRPDGSVLAMVGGRDYQKSQFNRATDAKRQPGSAFKLFVFYAALRKGYSPGAIIDASPIEIDRWKPVNYGGRQFQSLTLTQAFAQSVNSAAIRLSQDIGLSAVMDAARDLGLDAKLTPVPSLALGTSEVALLDLTGAYASILAGSRVQPWGIKAYSINSSHQQVLGPPELDARSLEHLPEMKALLRSVVEQGTGRRAAIGSQRVAGKTGTSQDYRDAWFLGFTDELVVGVWVGNDDNTPMKKITGGSLPAEIWRDFVASATPLLKAPRQTPPIASLSIVSDVAPEPIPAGLSPSASEGGPATCNFHACSATYASFRASDCTFQPYSGPRRYCDRQRARTKAFSSPRQTRRNRRERQADIDGDEFYFDDYGPPPWYPVQEYWR